MCFCSICVKSNINKNKSKHNKSKSHKHKEKISVVVKEYEFIRPDFNKIDSVNFNCARDCCTKYFYTSKNSCSYDIEMTNGNFVTGSISDEKLKQIVPKNGFINKLAMKIYSSLSKVNIRYYLKLPIPILHRQFFRIIFQIPENVKTHCNDLDNPFHFACREWHLDNQSL